MNILSAIKNRLTFVVSYEIIADAIMFSTKAFALADKFSGQEVKYYFFLLPINSFHRSHTPDNPTRM